MMLRLDELPAGPLDRDDLEACSQRGRAAVILSGIRGATVVEVNNLRVWPGSRRDGDSQGLNLFTMDMDWPDFVEFEEIVYFLGIEDGNGRNYRVFRILERAGNRIRLETGRAF